MRTCANCGASNADVARYCNECGTSMTRAASEAEPEPRASPPITDAVDAHAFARSISSHSRSNQSSRKADIMFVLDCTSSMRGEIAAITESITAFADTIQSDGVRARVGLIEFRDRLINEEHRVLTFDGEPFTSDAAAFRREVGRLRASGGGDAPESSLDAIMLALRQPFSADGDRVIVLVTDAPPHVPDRETRSIDEVTEAVRSKGIHQLYIVIRTQDPESQVYLQIMSATRGLAFDLGKGDDFRDRAEHFKKTLMSLGKTISKTL